MDFTIYISCRGRAAWLRGRHIGGRARRDSSGLPAVYTDPAVGAAAGLYRSLLCQGGLLRISLVTSKFGLQQD